MNDDPLLQRTSAAEELDLKKALDLSGGAAIIPEVVSEGLRRFVITRSPIYAMIPKIPWSTNAYIYRDITSEGSAAVFAADGAALPAASQGTYNKRTVNMKFVYVRGEVTGPMIAASSYYDALQTELIGRGNRLVRLIEQKILTGDTTGDANEFDGLIKQISTNAHDATSTQLTLSTLDIGLDKPDQYPSAIICSRAMSRRIWALLQAQQRFVDRVQVEGGFRVPSYNELPIVRVDNSITGLTTTIVMPDWEWTRFVVNQDIAYEPLAKTKDSEDFFLKMYCTLAVEGETLFHGKIINVTA